MAERYKIPIEHDRVERGELRILNRLKSRGFSVGPRSPIPEEYVFNVLPVNSDKAPENLMNIINTISILKEWDEGAVGMIAGVGLKFKNMEDATPGNSKLYDFGGWDYLYELGKKVNIAEIDIKKAVVQTALDPENRSAQKVLSTLLSAATKPDWIDTEKSTHIEQLAASFVTNNEEASQKIKKFTDEKGSSHIQQAASIQKTNANIEIELPIKPLKWPWLWLVSILKSLSTVEIFHEIAHKMTMGAIDSEARMYKSGLIRSSTEEKGVYEIVRKILDDKPGEADMHDPHEKPKKEASH